ncbi:MAG TPA: NAD(P)/FAD-dependent oxidoreductase [Candidatus Binatia bacterium]
MRRFDAAVVGAGPAGSAAAICLARRGYAVALIDKAVFPRDKLCGDFLNPAGWNLFARLGIRDALLASEHQKVTAFRVSTASAEALIPFTRVFGVGMRRRAFDDLLVKQAVREGALLYEGVKLAALERDGGGWKLRGEDDAGEREFFSRLVIGADGRNSWSAQRLGAITAQSSAGRFVGFQLNLAGCRVPAGEIQIHAFPGGYAGLMALGGGAANLSFAIDKTIAREQAIEAIVANHFSQNPHLKEAVAPCTIAAVRSIYPLDFAPRRRYGDGFLIAGDAARVTEPVTGEGVYFALKSGELAAAAADAALSCGDVSARQLAGYHAACRGALARRQAVNRLIRALILRPYLMAPLMRLRTRNNFPINRLVDEVCRAEP